MKQTLRHAAVVAALCALTVAGLGCDNKTTNTNNANTNAVVNQNRNANANANVARADADNDDYSTPDGLITAKTKLALMADKDASAFDVDVDTAQNVVTLSGKVETDAAKAAAERVANGIEGVKTVNNQLQVVPDAKATAVDDSDENIRKAVNDLLDNDANIKDLDLRGEVNAGVVTLKGSVANPGELVRAAQAIRKVKGVKGVATTSVKMDADARPAGTTNANGNAAKH